MGLTIYYTITPRQPIDATEDSRPITAAELTKQFTKAQEPDVLEILDTLVALARAHPGDTQGTFVR
jgi:hypothetical protein